MDKLQLVKVMDQHLSTLSLTVHNLSSYKADFQDKSWILFFTNTSLTLYGETYLVKLID